MTDEMLDHHATTFIAFKMKQLIKITFAQFLNQPEFYTDRAIEMTYGNGLNISNGMKTTVEI